jgi:hypothetical protein
MQRLWFVIDLAICNLIDLALTRSQFNFVYDGLFVVSNTNQYDASQHLMFTLFLHGT